MRKNAHRSGSRSRFFVPLRTPSLSCDFNVSLALVSSRDVGFRASWASSIDSRLAAAGASTRFGAFWRAANRDAFNDVMTAVNDVYRESTRQIATSTLSTSARRKQPPSILKWKEIDYELCKNREKLDPLRARNIECLRLLGACLA